MALDMQSAIELTYSEKGFVNIPVDIKPRESHKMETLLFKVDSGASCTAIGRKKLATLGFDEAWVKTGRLLKGDERPSVASGAYLEGCYEIVLPEIRIGNWVGYNWPFITCLDKTVEFKQLLGTNSMMFFNWELDYGHNVCRFKLIPGKRRLLFSQKEQSIHAIDDIDA